MLAARMDHIVRPISGARWMYNMILVLITNISTLSFNAHKPAGLVVGRCGCRGGGDIEKDHCVDS